MPFRELTMIDVKEILRRWSAGQSDRKIAREAGVDRKTAARYTGVATSLFERGRELADDEVHEVAQRGPTKQSKYDELVEVVADGLFEIMMTRPEVTPRGRT